MKSKLPKVLHALAGKPLLQHVVDTCHSLRAASLNIVIGHGAEQVKDNIDVGDLNANWVVQEEQLGTGHAVKMTLPHLDKQRPVLILYGDVPLIHHDTLSLMVDTYQKDPSGITLMTLNLDDPTGYGRIIRDGNGRVTGIVEQKDATPLQLKVQEVNTGILCCNGGDLARWLAALNNDNAQGEYYLTDIIAMAVNEGRHITTTQPANTFEVEGVNNLAQLANLERVWQRYLAEQLMAGGVTIRDPARFDLRGSLTCENDVSIDINCIFEGRVVLHEGVKVGANCILKNCEIGAGSEIKPNTIIEESILGQNCSAGPFARIRPGSELVENAHIGNFVEVKKSRIGRGSKAGHLAYLGDSEIGERVNIGAGTITCNYDGANKYKTIIEDDAFIGSDSQLVAPVKIGKGVTVGAGTTVTADVEDAALCISRVKQKHIPNWQRPKKLS